MVLTRSGSASPVKKGRSGSAPSKPAKEMIAPTPALKSGEPLRVIIAPRTLSAAARFISLSNPVTEESERYLLCPETGIHQLTRTTTPKHDPHSILFTPVDIDNPVTRDVEAISNGYVNKSAEFLTATPYDLSFTLLPLLTNSAKSNLFQSVDDILEPSDTKTYDLPYILQKFRTLVEEAIVRVCDVVEAGDDSLYRYSSSKTLQLLITKARRACENGLPASLEERFVTRVLEAPMLSVKREESTISIAAEQPQETAADPGTPLESFDSQSTTASVAPSIVFSESSAVTTTSTVTTTTETTITATTSTTSVPSEIVTLQRLLTSFKYIVHSYLPPQLALSLLTALQDQSSSGIDFAPLTAHLTHIAKLRADAAASIDISSFSRKRGLEDDFEAEERAEKKKKLEEEEKRKKASQSRGVQQLSKVDVKGMKKMSAFFTKMPAKGKS